MKPKIKKICEYCGEPFEVCPSLKNQKYDSRNCQGRASRKPKIKKTCEYCGKSFEVIPSRKNQRFHNEDCQRKGLRSLKIKKICEYCGEEFETIPALRNQKYCPGKCVFLATSGENSSGWRGKSLESYGPEFDDQLKEEIRKRDNYTCQNCGKSQAELETKLHIHHIDYDKKNSRSENLISLCNSCHGKTTKHRLAWQWIFNLPAGDYWQQLKIDFKIENKKAWPYREPIGSIPFADIPIIYPPFPPKYPIPGLF